MRLGILGGTFDPIHLGHLLLAEQAREALDLDRVLLMPAARPPHKPDAPISDFADRLRMVALAAEESDGLFASDLERDAGVPSFTVATLRRLRAQEPEAELWLILGGDSLRDLPTWREPEEIVRLARIAVYPRPGEDEASANPPAQLLGASATHLPGPRVHLASTEIRARVAAGRSIRFLVPRAVERYIEERGLYLPATEAR
ncbi:MAG: nicotinate-nucleotide adenylyltransferase [Candidatus Eisenbacteria bacterium]